MNEGDYMEAFVQKFKDYQAGKVLDVGTGSGKYIPTLQTIFKQYHEIIGIDMDTLALQNATTKYFGNEQIKFIEMNAEELLFEDHEFDTVCISNAIHHMPPESKTIKQMLRVLKTNGIILINELICDKQNEFQQTHVMYHHFSADIDMRLGIYHHYTYTKQEIISFVQNKGISIDYLYEYNESKEDVMAKQDISLLTQACRNHITRTSEFEDHIEFKQRGEEIIDRLHSIGVQRPTQLMIIGIV